MNWLLCISDRNLALLKLIEISVAPSLFSLILESCHLHYTLNFI